MFLLYPFSLTHQFSIVFVCVRELGGWVLVSVITFIVPFARLSGRGIPPSNAVINCRRFAFIQSLPPPSHLGQSIVSHFVLCSPAFRKSVLFWKEGFGRIRFGILESVFFGNEGFPLEVRVREDRCWGWIIDGLFSLGYWLDLIKSGYNQIHLGADLIKCHELNPLKN